MTAQRRFRVLDERMKNPGRVIGPEGLQGRFRCSLSRSPQQYSWHAHDEDIRHHSVRYLLLTDRSQAYRILSGR